MRWSLVLSAFIAVQSALSLFCVALPVPPQSDELERRGLKLSSKEYRENAKDHPVAYHFNGLGAGGKLKDTATVTAKTLGKGKRSDHAEKLLKSGNPIHADHVFEVQMLKDHLREHKVQFNNMDAGLQKKVKNILNGPKNMALIPGSVNSSKGQLIKHGMRGNKVKPQPVRDTYALESYRTAHKTAKKLDKVLQKHPGYSAAVGSNTLRKKLHDTFVSAGLPPGSHKHSSSGSSSGSSGSSSRSSSGSPGPSKKSKKSKKSNPGPSTPPPSGPGRQTKKRQVSSGNSPKTQKKKRS